MTLVRTLVCAVAALGMRGGLALAQGGAGAAAADGAAAGMQPALVIPFEMGSNKIYLKTLVNGEGPYPFVLDTGAPFSVVDWDLATSLGIKVFETGQVGGAGEGRVKLGTMRGVRLEVGGLQYEPRKIEAIPLNGTLAQAEGRDVMGLVGGDVAERFVCEFAFAENELRLHTPTTFKYEGEGSRVKVTIEGHVLARASVKMPGREAITGRFIIDTGARLAVALNTHVVEDHQLLADDIKHVKTVVGWGLGGPLEHGVARAESVSIGSLTFDAPTVTLSEDTRGVLAGRTITGIIGNEVLKRTRMFLDYPREELILEPNEAAMKVRFPADCSGLFITAGGESYRVFTVHAVAPGTPASEAGIAKDDVIERIDGGPALRYSLEELRELLRAPGRTYEVELKRGEERRGATLVTRELI